MNLSSISPLYVVGAVNAVSKCGRSVKECHKKLGYLKTAAKKKVLFYFFQFDFVLIENNVPIIKIFITIFAVKEEQRSLVLTFLPVQILNSCGVTLHTSCKSSAFTNYDSLL